jgi:two-component system NtrC family response regulator
VKRAIVMAEGNLISAADMDLQNARPDAEVEQLDLRAARLGAELRVLQLALAEAGGNLSQVAKRLGITRPTLYSLMESHGLALKSQGSSTTLAKG